MKELSIPFIPVPSSQWHRRDESSVVIVEVVHFDTGSPKGWIQYWDTHHLCHVTNDLPLFRKNYTPLK